MAKEPDDKHGASDSSGDETPAKSNRPQDDLSAISPGVGDEQSELPLDDESSGDASKVGFPKANFPEASFSESAPVDVADDGEPARDDQAQDDTGHEDSHHTGGLDSGHDDPYHDEYSHDHHDEYHQEHYDEYVHEDSDAGGSADSGGGYGGGYNDDNESNDGEDDEDGQKGESFGGPIKPFLNHLEDLRWTVMKCVIALAVGMLIALIGAGYIVDILAGPLKEAQKMEKVLAQGNPEKRTIPVLLGEGVVGSIHEVDLKELQEKEILHGAATNLRDISSINLVPIQIANDQNGSRYALVMHVDTSGTKETKWSLELKAFGPMKAFMIALRIGLYGGFAIALPFVLYFIAQFVLPALKVREKHWLFRITAFGSILFAIGVAFAYYIIMEIALWASVGFAEMLGLHSDEWQAEEYISFVCMFMIGMGVAFLLPLVLLFLVKIGLLNYKKLSDWRMYAVVANLIVSAVLTPTGDPFTLLLVAFPLYLLYEISIIIAWVWHKRDAKKEAEEQLGN